MSRWAVTTPLEALECAVATGGLMQSMRSRRDRGTPGEGVAHIMKRQPEIGELLKQLRAEHMFVLREDYVKAFVEPRSDDMDELWRRWHAQVGQKRRLVTRS